MNAIRRLREVTGMTQAELAAAAGTSQPTVAAYEAGRKSPTLDTLRRLAEAAGLEAIVAYHPPLTREERRSLALHEAVARRLLDDPEPVLGAAQGTLRLMRAVHPHAHGLLDDWTRHLERSVEELAAILRDPSPHARELRHVTPFAGVLSAGERAAAIRRFRRERGDDP